MCASGVWRRRASAVYVYGGAGSEWSEDAKLTASDGGAQSLFGRAVAVAGDTIAVGAPGTNGGQGAAYLFTGEASSWTEEANLTPLESAGSEAWFGYAVAIGRATLVVGAPRALVEGEGAGAAYLYTETVPGAWTRQRTFTADGGAAAASVRVRQRLAGGQKAP